MMLFMLFSRPSDKNVPIEVIISAQTFLTFDQILTTNRQFQHLIVLNLCSLYPSSRALPCQTLAPAASIIIKDTISDGDTHHVK